jgi:hypothetical protein
MHAVRVTAPQPPLPLHPAAQAAQLNSLRAAFLSEAAPAAEPEPTLPPEGAAATAHATFSASAARAEAPRRSLPRYKHSALGELDNAAHSAAAAAAPVEAQQLRPKQQQASSSTAPEAAAAASGAAVNAGDDDGGGPKGLRPGFVGVHEVSRHGKPLALHGPNGDVNLRAEGQAAGPAWLVRVVAWGGGWEPRFSMLPL